jgi:hypothetical protein
VGYLYKLDFASGKSYVGMTHGKLSSRISQHRCDAAGGVQLPVHRAWRKHGEPTVTVLAIANGDYLLEIEKRAVEVYDTFKGGYNASPGGDLIPVMTPEIRAKISAAAKGRVASAETRAKMSARRKGRPLSAEALAKLVASRRRGVPLSAEHKRKISDMKLAQNLKATPEARAKMSKAHAGVPKSTEHNQKNGLAHWRQQWHSMAWACDVRVGRQRQLDLDGGA